MPRLGALLAPRRILAAPGRRARRIGARRLRRVPRRAIQLTLKCRDPLVLLGDPHGQLLDLRLKPLILRRQRQQHRHDRIPTLFIDRLSLAPLHTTKFDAPRLCPPNQLNAYEKRPQTGPNGHAHDPPSSSVSCPGVSCNEEVFGSSPKWALRKHWVFRARRRPVGALPALALRGGHVPDPSASRAARSPPPRHPVAAVHVGHDVA
jgi:hypothetical protein